MNLFQLATAGVDVGSLPDQDAPRAPIDFGASAAPQGKFAAPQELESLFDAAASEYGVDPTILKGIAFAESRFRPDIISGKVTSPAGAVGLMQFMPATAKEMGINPLDPAEAVFGAAAYLRQSLDKFDGDVEKAVASYNFGRNRDLYTRPDWYKGLPAETRNYVGTVLEFADGLQAPAAEPEPAKSQQVPLPSSVTPSNAGGGRGSVSPGMINTKMPRTAVPDMTVGGVARDVASGLLQIGPTAVKGVGELARLVSGDNVGKGLTDFADRGNKAIQEVVGSERAQAQRQNFAADMADEGVSIGQALLNNKGAMADMALPQLGSMLIPVGVAGAAGKAATVGKAAQVLDKAALASRVAAAQQAAGIGATAAQNAASTFAELVDKGVSLKDAYLGAGITVPFSVIAGKLTGGGAEGALIRSTLGDAVKKGATEVPKAMLREGGQEVGEELGQVLGEAVGTGKAPTATATGKRMAVAGVLGGLMGGGVDVATQAMAPRVEAQPTTPQVPVVTKQEPTIDVTYQTADGRTVTDVVPGNTQKVKPDTAQSQSVDSIAQAILEAESKAAQPAAQPLTGIAAELEALRARNKTSQSTTPQTTEAADAAPATGVPELGAQAADDSRGSAPVADAVQADADGRNAGLPGAPAPSRAELGTGSDGGRVDSNDALTQPLQESANAQAATQTTADTTRPLPAARPAAVEAAGVAPEIDPATRRPTASWVVRDKSTGNVVLETAQKGVAEKINTEKYEAVPIGQHLASLSNPVLSTTQAQDGTTTQNLGAQATPTAGTQVKPQSKREEVEAEFSSGAGSFAEKLSAKLSDTRYKLMQAESMNPLQQRLSGVDLHAMRAEIARLDGLAVAAKEADAASLTAESSRWILKSARQELDASNLNEQERVQAVQKAQAKGNAADAAQSIFSDVDAAASPQGTAGTQTQENTRIGRDNTPLTDGGQPFKTRKAAADAKKLQPMMRVVKVDGGYALAEKTPAQIAAMEKAAQRLRNANTSPAGEPIPAHSFIAAAGGMQAVTRNDMGVDGNPRVGNRRLFAGAGRGLSIEQATQMLIADGYLAEGASQNDAYALIKKSLTQPQYNATGYEQMAEMDAAARFDDYLAAQEESAMDADFDPFADGLADGYIEDDFDASGFAGADEQIQLEVRALQANADALGLDSDALIDEAVRATVGKTDLEYYEYAKQLITNAIRSANSASTGGRSNGEAVRDGQEQPRQGPQRGSLADDSTIDGGQGSPGADGEGLTRYTAEEVTGRQDAVAQAEAATQRAENAAGKAEAAAKQAKEIAQRSVAAADTFELGGNAEDNLSGQGGLQFSKTSKPIAILDGSEVAAEITHDNAVEVAREWYRANLQGDTVIRDGFGEVRFTSKGWGELKLGLRNDALKAKLLPAVRSLIQSGEYHGREELYKQRADSITAFHFFSGKVSVDGKVVTAGVTVGEDAFGNLFYNVTHNESRFWKDRSPLVLPRENAEGPKGLLVDGEPPTKQSMSDDDGNVNLVILDGASSVTPVATIRTALASAYGNLLSRLESKGLVTLTQTQDEAIDAAARARADKTGQPLAEVRASLMGSVSNTAIGNNGNFDPNDLDIRRSANGAVQGFFDPQTGQSFLIADNLTAESAPGTLMHEVGIHMAADGKLQPLFDRALQLLKLGRNNPFIQRVQSRMDAAGETSGEEAAAYIVTEYENDRAGAPSSVASWVKDFIADVRAWLFSKGVLLKAEQLSMADIAAVARANARSMAQGDAGGLQGVGLVLSRGGNPTPPIPTSAQNGLFNTPPWQLPEATHTDKLIYELQDGRVDLKRVQEAIAATGKTITEGFDARMAETLLPGRVARRTETFLAVEAKPLLESMAKNNVSQDELSDYLLARHAPERNAQVAKVNPDMPDGGAGTNSQGVLMTTQAARDHISALTAGKRTALELLARQVDAITAGTRDILVREGLEKQETIDAWMGAYKHYVPLFKDESMDTMAHPMGAGLSVTGSASRRATGSTGEVTNMLAHVLMQRETAITRAEKNRAAMSLYGLALTNPNAEMWTTIRPSMPADQIADELVRMGVDPMDAEVGMQGVPTIRGVDPVSGKVVDRPNPMYKRLDNALTVKVNGEDRVILFNAENERAMRLVRNLKNQDGVLAHLDLAGSFIGKATRYFASINTQYNPAFGMVNVIRDVGGALVNLSDTALAGKQARVLSDSIPAAIGIARDLRGDAQRTPWSDLWQQFQDDGGRTGYRDLFTDPYKRAEAVQSELDKLSKQGTLTPGAAAHAVLDLLDDFNTTLENGVRLSAYKAALDQGLSRAEAARLARELTLDFNRKGRAGRELGPLFAFFNASVQGTARTLKALQGPAGKRILIGGVGLGVMQALMLAAAGFDDDEIPEFVKARALIIPMPGKQYIAIPLQFGLNALPNTGRVATELLMSGGKDWAEKSFNALGELAGSFNPLGGGNIFTGSGLLKTVAPTVVDPIVDITTNTDFTGKPIGKERMPWDTRPGFAMARESTQRAPTGQAYVGISKAINSLSGGNDFARGLASPSPEEVRYVFTTLGGGVYRELEKVLNASLLTAQGETLKAREVPFGSRFAGEVEDADVQRGRYFKNNAKLEKLEAQLKGLSKEGRGEELRALVKDNPEIQLYELNNQVSAELAKLNKLAAQSINDRETLKRIDEVRTQYMRALNDKMRELEKAAKDRAGGDKVPKK